MQRQVCAENTGAIFTLGYNQPFKIVTLAKFAAHFGQLAVGDLPAEHGIEFSIVQLEPACPLKGVCDRLFIPPRRAKIDIDELGAATFPDQDAERRARSRCAQGEGAAIQQAGADFAHEIAHTFRTDIIVSLPGKDFELRFAIL